MSSSRKQLIDVVAANCAAIKKADGFNTDAGLKVSTESVQIPNGSAATINVRWEVLQKATDPAVKRTHRLTIIRIAILVPTSLDDAEALLDGAIDDVERVMPGNPSSYPRGISFPEFLDTTPAPSEDGKKWIGAVIRYQSHVPIR